MFLREIKIGQYNYDPATGSLARHQREKKTPQQVFDEVKRKRHDLIRAHSIRDEELKELIKKVLSGTRNTAYLARGADYSRLRDIAAFIVREYSY